MNQQKNENYQNKDDINLIKDKYFKNIILKGIKETNGNGANGSSYLNYNETDKSEYNDEMDFFKILIIIQIYKIL